MKFLIIIFSLALLSNSLLAQPNQFTDKIDTLCNRFENNSNCQIEITIDSSKLVTEPYIIKFFRSNKSGRLSYVQYQLLKPNVTLKYFYDNEKLIKVSGIDQSTEITFTPTLYFENGKLIYLTHRSIDGDNSGKYFLKKSNEYMLYFLLNNKTP